MSVSVADYWHLVVVLSGGEGEEAHNATPPQRPLVAATEIYSRFHTIHAHPRIHNFLQSLK